MNSFAPSDASSLLFEHEGAVAKLTLNHAFVSKRKPDFSR
jgi:hypothetical protein